MDRISKEQRSWNMSQVKSTNTKPELILRSALHKKGYRFRINGKISIKYDKKGFLPGKPDIILPKYHTVIFVNGCFWHQHKGCLKATTPKTNTKFWTEKLQKNTERDTANIIELNKTGWNVIVVWECEIITNVAIVINRIIRNLNYARK